MKFLADECCDNSMVKGLREMGYDVLYVQENRSGATDSEVLLKAFHDQRILITEDKDFGELVYRLKKPVYGVILLRFHPLEKKKKMSRLSNLIANHAKKLKGNFLVVDENKTRVRPLNSSE